MSILNQFNNGARFEYDNEKEREFIDFKELHFKIGDEPITVEALFINTKSKFGDAPVIFTNEYMVNAPQHMTEVVNQMRVNDDVVKMINERRVGLKLYKYTNSYGEAVGGEWVEL